MCFKSPFFQLCVKLLGTEDVSGFCAFSLDVSLQENIPGRSKIEYAEK